MLKNIKKAVKTGGNYSSDLFKDKRIMTVASSWVFYFLLALLPIVFLMVNAFTVFNSSFCSDLIFSLPSEFRPAGEMLLSTAQKASSGVTVLFVFSMIFSGSTLFNQMSKDGEYLYGISPDYNKGITRRIISIFAFSLLFVTFLGLAFLITFWERVIMLVPFLQNAELIVKIISIIIAISLCYGIIILLNIFICPVKQSFKGVVFGAFVSLFIIVMGTLGFVIYLRLFSAMNTFYGSLLGIIVFLIWAYILMLGLVTGSSVSVMEYNKQKKIFGDVEKNDIKNIQEKRRKVNA